MSLYDTRELRLGVTEGDAFSVGDLATFDDRVIAVRSSDPCASGHVLSVAPDGRSVVIRRGLAKMLRSQGVR